MSLNTTPNHVNLRLSFSFSALLVTKMQLGELLSQIKRIMGLLISSQSCFSTKTFVTVMDKVLFSSSDCCWRWSLAQLYGYFQSLLMARWWLEVVMMVVMFGNSLRTQLTKEIKKTKQGWAFPCIVKSPQACLISIAPVLDGSSLVYLVLLHLGSFAVVFNWDFWWHLTYFEQLHPDLKFAGILLIL